jgi:hypothetical protein
LITIDQYFGKFDALKVPELVGNATLLLAHVNEFLKECEKSGIVIHDNPKTGSQISGELYGGIRPVDCPIGAHFSSHKQGLAVDIYDPDNKLDDFITDALLEKHHLYREAPSTTLSWCHVTVKPPKSGNRTFIP